MQQYKAQIFSVLVVVILFCVAIIDIGRGVLQLRAIKSQESMLQQAVMAKQVIQPKSEQVLHNRAQMMTDIFHLAQLYGLHIQSMVPKSVPEGVEINLVMQGSFTQLINFIERDLQTKFLCLIKRMKVAAGQDGNTKIVLSLMIGGSYPHGKTNRHAMALRRQDPFAVQYEYVDSERQYDFSMAQKFSWQQIRLVGYVRKQNNLSAVLLLPNQKTFIAHVGDALGLERAMIVSIHEDAMLLRCRGKQIVFHYT